MLSAQAYENARHLPQLKRKKLVPYKQNTQCQVRVKNTPYLRPEQLKICTPGSSQNGASPRAFMPFPVNKLVVNDNSVTHSKLCHLIDVNEKVLQTSRKKPSVAVYKQV